MIGPILFEPIENNPYFWWNGLEIPIQLKYLFEAVIKHDKTIEELVTTINKLASEIDSVISEEVVKKINEMYESGELAEIIENLTTDYLDKHYKDRPNNSNLEFERIFRANYNMGDNIRWSESYINQMTITPSLIQSGTHFTYNNIDYIAYCLIPSGVHSYGYSNSGVIVVIRDYGNGEFGTVGQLAVSMGHMNSIDFNPKDNCLYIAHLEDYDVNHQTEKPSNSQLVHRIHIDEVIGSTKGGLNTGSYYTSFPNGMYHLTAKNSQAYKPTSFNTYDLKHISNIFDKVASNNISYSNDLPSGTMYVGYGVANIFKVDFINSTCERAVSISLANKLENLRNRYDWVDQTATISGKYVYVLGYKPNVIVRGNIETDEIEYIYNIPEVVSKGMWAVGEPEQVKIRDNGDIYLFSFVENGQNQYRQCRTVQIFKGNIYRNQVEPTLSLQNLPLTVYVDTAIYSSSPDGTESKPFQNIFEAVTFANNQQVSNAVNIIMKSSSNYACEISGSKKIYITRSDSEDFNAPDNWNRKAQIGGIMCSGTNNLILRNLAISNSYPLMLPTSRYYNPSATLPQLIIKGNVQIWQSNVVFSNILFQPFYDQFENDMVPRKYAIHIEYSSGILSGAYSEDNGSFTVGYGKQGDETSATQWLQDPENDNYFIHANNSTFNAHGFSKLGKNVYA